MVGIGAFNVTNNFPPQGAPAPPFDPTSADNGLSVDPVTGRIVLGNDLGGTGADLLSDRWIQTLGFNVYLEDNPGQFLRLAGSVLQLEDGGNSITELQPGFLALENFSNGTAVNLNSNNGLGPSYLFLDSGNIMYDFFYDTAAALLRILSTDFGSNGLELSFDDANGLFNFFNTANTAALTINGVPGFTGTVTPVNSITVDGGIVTAVT